MMHHFQTLEAERSGFSNPWKNGLLRFPMLGKLALALLLCSAARPAGAAGAEGVVKEVKVERRGGGAMEPGSVMAYVSTKVGE